MINICLTFCQEVVGHYLEYLLRMPQGDINAVIPCCAGEEVILFPNESSIYDPIRYQLDILTSAVRSAVVTYRNRRCNVGAA